MILFKAYRTTFLSPLFILVFAGLLATEDVYSATAREIDASVKTCLQRFKKEVPASEEYLKIAKGILIIPKVVKAGFIFGGEYGEGALLVKNKTVEYYSIASASFGLQIGAQKKDIILIFIENESLKEFRRSSGFKIGIDGSIAFIDVGKGTSVDTTKIQDPIIGFVIGQKGLMGNITLEGSKFTRLKSKKQK